MHCMIMNANAMVYEWMHFFAFFYVCFVLFLGILIDLQSLAHI